MARRSQAWPDNVAGEFFVDRTCIDCGLCRELAPHVFTAADGYSRVHTQPQNDVTLREAARALLACPTSSIGAHAGTATAAVADFPLPMDGPVSFCGFSSAQSFGGRSWFVQRAEGNWLIDAPRWTPVLVERFRALGGIRRIFITHADDVAAAPRYAAAFAAELIIHAGDRHAAPTATVLSGDEPHLLAPGCLAIPSPGHTAGSQCLLIDERWLFTGDHLWWNRAHRGLHASRRHCWHDWDLQIASLRRLLAYRFAWVLPGHGEPIGLEADAMHAALAALIARCTRA